MKQTACSDEEYVYTLGPKMQMPETNVEINWVTVKMMTDTDASTDTVNEEAFQAICQPASLT